MSHRFSKHLTPIDKPPSPDAMTPDELLQVLGALGLSVSAAARLPGRQRPHGAALVSGRRAAAAAGDPVPALPTPRQDLAAKGHGDAGAMKVFFKTPAGVGLASFALRAGAGSKIGEFVCVSPAAAKRRNAIT